MWQKRDEEKMAGALAFKARILKFAQVSNYGFGYDDYQVGFAGPIRMWQKDKFERWREEETKDYKGKMGYVKFGVKGRGEVEGEDMNINKH